MWTATPERNPTVTLILIPPCAGCRPASVPPASSAADVEPMARAHSISSADLLTAPATSQGAALPIASLHTSHQVSPP